jgi:cell division protease FtsH
MLSTQQKFSIGYCILTVLGLLLIHTVFSAPQSENLSYRDFKTLLKAGKVVDLTLRERTITGHLTTDGLEGLLPKEKMDQREHLRKNLRFCPTRKADGVPTT